MLLSCDVGVCMFPNWRYRSSMETAVGSNVFRLDLENVSLDLGLQLEEVGQRRKASCVQHLGSQIGVNEGSIAIHCYQSPSSC
jgi:hypothetical protein